MRPAPTASRSGSITSFARRAYVWLALGCATIIAAAAAAEALHERATLEAERAARLQGAGQRVAQAFALPLAAGNQDAARPTLEILAVLPEFAAARLLDEDGRVLLEKTNGEAADRATERVPIASPDDPSRIIGTLELSLSRDALNAHVRDELIHAGASALAQLAVLLIMLIVVMRALSRPLLSVAGRMLSVAEGRLDDVVPCLDRRDVVGDIARSTDLFRRYAIERELTTGELRSARDQLEVRVAERTSELQRLNAALEREIAERQKAESALRRSEARLTSLFDNAPTTLTLRDRNGRFRLINRQFASWFGVTPETALGRTASELFGSPGAVVIEQTIRDVIDSNAPRSLQIALSFADGKTHALAMTLFPIIDPTSGEMLAASMAIDVTEQRVLETQLQQIETAGAIEERYRDLTHLNRALEREVAERRLAEDALRRSEARLASIFENAPITITLRDPSGRYLFVNRRYVEWYGLPAEQVVGHKASELFADPYAVVSERALQEVVETGETRTLEFNPASPAGRAMTVLLTLFPIRDPMADTLVICGMSIDVTEQRRLEAELREIETTRAVEERTRDLTELNQALEREIGERRKAEDALRQSEARLSTIFDNAPTSISLRDANARFLFVNRRFEEWFGFKAIDALGRTAADLYRTEGAAQVDERVRRIAATGRGETFDFSLTFADRQRHTVSSTAFPIVDPICGRTVVCNMIVDVTEQRALEAQLREMEASRAVEERTRGLTELNQALEREIAERRKAEAALRQSEARLAGILDNAPTAFSLRDDAGRYLFISRRHQQWFGYRTDQVLGRTAEEVFETADESVREVLRLARETQQPQVREYTTRFADGALHTISVSTFLVPDPVLGANAFCAVAVDVTEQRALEIQLRHSEKTRALGQLTGGIAHDFNNLLMVIMANADVLELRLPGDPMLASILRAVDRGQRLTDRLLAYSRKSPLRPVPIDLGELVAGMADVLRRTLGETIEIRTVRAPDLWAAEADPDQVEDALLNLALNARDAMPGGGLLTIESRNEVIDARHAALHRSDEVVPGDYVMIVVADTGGGMTPEIVERVYEPFFTTKSVGEGSGLGLSMVYGFVRQSGGHIDIESSPGRGTTVRLYLRRSLSDVALPPETSRDDGTVPQARAGEVVLLVEDDPEVRRLTAMLIEELGYRVLGAGDGVEALAASSAAPRVDLLVSDVMLPKGMTGVELASRLKLSRGDLAVLFVSGYSEDAIIKSGTIDRDINLLTKPFHKASLARAMRLALDQVRGLS